ncbi:MAG: aspartate carbamoyltransferase catalytic subunit [Alphaproteobacteria bacterium]|nr:aspartate carbamoyltransferase catalytic subunit [Alphaproteobacteria bacterium]
MSSVFAHRHLLDIERLSKADIEAILDLAARYAAQNRSANKTCDRLKGKAIINLFFEDSTRTRASFELAAKRLGADTVNIPVETSSIKKGETLLDTVLTLDAMQIDGIVMRHNEDGAPHFVAPHVKAHIINAGDGKNEHPTQALLDALTILRHKKKIDGLTVAICGDVAHSRVARSNAVLLAKLGAKVRLVAPPVFALPNFGNLNVECSDDMQKGLAGADVVMALRIQRERIGASEQKIDTDDYARAYRLDHTRIGAAKPDAIVMHPGPANRGVEITDELADDPERSVIREQVEMGVAVRMAVLDLLLSGQENGHGA